MSKSSNLNIAIIGSGLAGLCLALALAQQGIPCTVFESRASPLNIGGAVMLSPNALRVLDALGLYPTIQKQGHNFDTLYFRDTAGALLEEYEIGSKEKYGYSGLRIFRTVVIDTLLNALKEKTKVELRFARKFSHVATERHLPIRRWHDGDSEHPRRRGWHPPTFTGMMGITAAVPTAQLQLPAGYHLPVPIVHPAQSKARSSSPGPHRAPASFASRAPTPATDKPPFASFLPARRVL